MTTSPGTPLTLRGNRIPPSLDETMIHGVVHGFYRRVRADADLGPVFEARIADDAWPHHLARMCDFWSSILLRTERYEGRPLPAHLRIPELSDLHFDRWLTLFRTTVLEECDDESAELFLSFAYRIARSFRMAVAFHRGEDTLSIPPLPIDAAYLGDAEA